MPRRSPPPAMPCQARDRVPRRAANPASAPPAPVSPDRQARSLAGTFRMAQLHPPVQRGEAAIASRLIEYRITLYRGSKRFRVAFLLHFERVEAGAQHEHELIAQHLAGGTQLALETLTLPQQPRLAVSAAVAEGRKHQGDHRKPVEIRDKVFDIAIVRPDHAGPPHTPRKTFRVLEKPRSRDQDRAIARNLGVIGHMDQRIAGNLSVFNEWHRPAP